MLGRLARDVRESGIVSGTAPGFLELASRSSSTTLPLRRFERDLSFDLEENIDMRVRVSDRASPGASPALGEG